MKYDDGIACIPAKKFEADREAWLQSQPNPFGQSWVGRRPAKRLRAKTTRTKAQQRANFTERRKAKRHEEAIALGRQPGRAGRPSPVTVFYEGVRYDYLTDLARHLGIHQFTVTRATLKGELLGKPLTVIRKSQVAA